MSLWVLRIVLRIVHFPFEGAELREELRQGIQPVARISHQGIT